jgi:hypothetical protein
MATPAASPYVTFVTFGRNDGYRNDYVLRTSKAISVLVQQLEAAKLEAEIIVSEWNPPPERALLVDSLGLPSESPYVSVRGIVSDASFHARFVGQERGMHSGEAWNVGIRRARGRYVTPKASDTFLSTATIERLARRDAEPDALYRVDRYDVAFPDELWRLDNASLLEALDGLPSIHLEPIEQPSAWKVRDLHTNASGDFLLMSAEWWHRVRGHPADDTTLTLDGDSLVMHHAAALGAREVRWPAPCKVYKPRHSRLNDARLTQVWKPWQRFLDNRLRRWGADDLADRARMLFDYPRRKFAGVDSVLAHSVERQLVLPASRWARGVPPVPTQPEDWGLARECLATRTLCRAAWEPFPESDASG